MSSDNQPQNDQNNGESIRSLGLFDCIAIIVGIIVGAGIFETSAPIAALISSPLLLLGVWLAGGLFSLAGAWSYIPLARKYPQHGGEYVYLNEVFGSFFGFLFAWGRFVIIQPGSIAAMLLVFGRYLTDITHSGAEGQRFIVYYAVFGASLLTALNVISIKTGKWTNNALTIAKVIGLCTIFAAGILGFFVLDAQPESSPVSSSNFGLALILVLFTYGGWNEIVYVAEEVKDPRRNIGKALVLGTLTVTVLYILATLAFLSLLGHAQMAQSSALASEAVGKVLGSGAPFFISALISISTLGAAHALLFTGSRVPYALGKDYRLLSFLASWNSRAQQR